MPKQWVDWSEQCEHCGSDTQVLTYSKEDDCAFDGDLVRCRECYCLGHIDVDDGIYSDAEDDEFSGCAYASWPDDACAKCYRDYGLLL